MAETLEELQAQLVALSKARAVTYSANGVSRTVTYKSDIEMRGAQMDLMQRIATFGEFERTVRVQSSKGLGDRLWRLNEPPR